VPPAELRDHLRIVLTRADEVATSVPIRALQKAAELAGGRKRLAERLGVKGAEIEKWLAGKEALPRDLFLRVVDLIIDEITPPGDPSEPNDAPPSRSSAPSSHRDRD
jgi:hypothetical protein